MSRFLLDTDVISMLSPSRTDAAPRFLDWLERMDGEGRIFLSVVSIHEIEKGIVLLEQKAAAAKAAALRIWVGGLTAAYADKILGLDAQAAVLSGRLEAMAILQGTNPGMADAAIAGIAKANELTIVSRNARHFRAFDGKRSISRVLPLCRFAGEPVAPGFAGVSGSRRWQDGAIG